MKKVKIKIQKFYSNLCSALNDMNIYALFVLSFLFVFFICFYNDYLSVNKSFIWYNDGMNLYMTKMVWFNRYIRQIVHNLLCNHKLVIPMWEFYFGEGTDIIQGFGGHIFSNDILVLLSPIFNEKFLPYYYSICQVIRLLLCGVSFIYLCKVCNKQNKFAIIISSLAYTFCAWNLLNLNRHFTFINWMIFFPLFIAGIEITLKKGKPYVYILVLSLIFLDIYYAYMVVLIALIYIPTRIFFVGYRNKYFLQMLIKYFFYSVISLLISAILFLPNFQILLNENRAIISRASLPQIFYKPIEYLRIFRSWISYSFINWTLLGYTSVTLIALAWLFTKRKYKSYLKLYVILTILFLSFPIFGKVFNGGGYITNRWTFSIALLCSYVLSCFLENVDNIDIKQFYIMTFFAAFYYLLSYVFRYVEMHNINFVNEIIILFLSIIIICIMSFNRKFLFLNRFLLLILCITSIFENSNYLHNNKRENYSKEAVPYDEYYVRMYNTVASYVRESTINDDDYFRYNMLSSDVKRNASLIENLSSQEYYTSCTNPNLQQFFKALSIPRNAGNSWINYDNNFIIDTLNSVKYEVTKHNTKQYGYSFFSKNNIIDVLKKDNYLPLMYSYNSYIDDNKFMKYNPIEKQEIMMQSAVIDEQLNNNFLNHNNSFQFTATNCKFDCMSNDKRLYIDKNYIVALEDNVKFDVLTDIPPNTESHFVVSNFNYKALHNYDFYFNKEYEFNNNTYYIDPNNLYDENTLSEDNVKELNIERGKWNEQTRTYLTISYLKKQYPVTFYNFKDAGYGGYHDFNYNLGYNNNNIDKITVTIRKKGLYTFDNMGLISIPLDSLTDKIYKLRDYEIKDIKVTSNTILSNIDFSKNKFLCCAMPYYSGWKAYIDGKETKLYRTNIRHMGIDVPAGKHIIEFKYTNYYLIYGCIVSLLGLVIFISLIIYNKRKEKEFYL